MTDWTTVSRIWRQALAHDARSRGAFLDDACAGTPALRRQVESLMNGGPEPDDSLVNGFQRFWEEVLSSPEDASTAEAVPEETLHRAHRILFATSPFSVLAPETIAEVLSFMHLTEHTPDDYLIRQGDPAEFLLLIISGRASARVRDLTPDRAPVGVFRPGDVVGEMSLVTDEPRTADVVADTPVRCLRLSAADFHALAERHPELRVVLTEVVTERLGHARHDGLGGKDIQGYRIKQCVGRGGMGVVYDATEVSTGRQVALKMMNHRLVYDVDGLNRFRREAAILDTLDHPSLARLYGRFSAFKTEFLAMEFCHGRTLSETIGARGPLSEELVRRVVGQLAVALQYVHARGIIHRDLKPSNILLTPSGVVKVLDFGLVTAERDSDMWSGWNATSRIGGLVGTPRYMAPEQFSNRALDRRVDFYALACVAFEALAGRSAVASTGVFEVMREHARLVLPPRASIGAGISSEMHDVIAGGLALERDKRVLDLERLATWAGPVYLEP
jgi:CRP-like cAMP-binding protein